MRVAYRMAICDDISEALDTAENMARDWANLRGFELEIDRFSSAPDFFADYENGRYDILLLDIEMGAVNGVELARRVRRGDHDAQIIFLTGYTDYIADGYDVEALNYLLKPVDRAKLFGVLDRAADRLRRQRLLNQCDLETVVQHHYTKGCMLRRNRYMVDRSSLLIAVYDGTPKGGTMNTLAYALRQGVETIILDV